mmetsp:Transcript_35251/g.111404  ORF Transcript_35251/g.111404 Transcript_35251/m.111404 type:complete len:245 (+) Transcript_35251:856-1590(+)
MRMSMSSSAHSPAPSRRTPEMRGDAAAAAAAAAACSRCSRSLLDFFSARLTSLTWSRYTVASLIASPTSAAASRSSPSAGSAFSSTRAILSRLAIICCSSSACTRRSSAATSSLGAEARSSPHPSSFFHCTSRPSSGFPAVTAAATATSCESTGGSTGVEADCGRLRRRHLAGAMSVPQRPFFCTRQTEHRPDDGAPPQRGVNAPLGVSEASEGLSGVSGKSPRAESAPGVGGGGTGRSKSMRV